MRGSPTVARLAALAWLVTTSAATAAATGAVMLDVIEGRVEDVGEDVAEGRAEIDLPASKLIIASRLNVTPETLSRVQHDLIEAGLISVHGRHIVIHDVRRLREYRP